MNSNTTPFNNIKWLFFDIDDTLWDFSKNSADTLQYLYNNTKLLQSLYPYYTEFYNLYHQINSELWKLYHYGKIDQYFLKTERFSYLLREKKIPHKEADNIGLQLNDVYLNHLGECRALIDNACQILQYLASKYMIAALSNGFNNIQYKKIYTTDLNRYITRMIVSDEIGIQKPDRRLFDYALCEVGCHPSQAVMIGDNPDADIRGARNAGWNTIFFNRHNNPDLQHTDADAMVNNLSDLKILL